jgi:hypothetical protein
MSRKNWEEVNRERLSGAAAQDGYNGARRAFEMGGGCGCSARTTE